MFLTRLLSKKQHPNCQEDHSYSKKTYFSLNNCGFLGDFGDVSVLNRAYTTNQPVLLTYQYLVYILGVKYFVPTIFKLKK
jgi:hypothetical protein